MPRPTSLIAFKAPVVKGADSVAVPILTEIGEWGELRATPGTLRNFALSILQHVDAQTNDRAGVPSHANPNIRQPVFKPSGRRVL